MPLLSTRSNTRTDSCGGNPGLNRLRHNTANFSTYLSKKKSLKIWAELICLVTVNSRGSGDHDETRRGRVHLMKLVVVYPVIKFAPFLGTRRFITVGTTSRQKSLYCAIWLHYAPYLPIIILPSTPRSPKWLFPIRLFNKKSVHISKLPHACHIPSPSHSPWFYRLITDDYVVIKT